MLHIHFSNRIEQLADALTDVLAQPPSAPLRPETMVVGHAGMGEWLKRALAARQGIAANMAFQQPAAFVWRLLRARHAELPRSSPLEKGPLVWRLYAMLTGPDKLPPELARYLLGADERAPFDLATALATVFEQYQIYRPEWIRDWEKGVEADDRAGWQAGLWRRVAGGATPNPARLYADFADNAHDLVPGNDLPPRVSVFGIAALAPVYLQLFAALAETRDVHLFVPNPSRAYWGDIEPESRLARWQLLRPERAEYATSGHPLLSALGMQTRDFIESLHDVSGEFETHEQFAPRQGSHILHRLQNDILDLVEQPAEQPAEADDDSVQVHVCHSRQREVEVLHDALLRLFEADATLGPEQILVMAPNMDDYADHIAAVFGAAPQERYIPWSLTDRDVRKEQPILEALLALLDLPESRLPVSQVIGWLELPAIARYYGLDAQSRSDLRRWVEAAGIRWGFDGAHRKSFDLPDEEGFSWRFGLDRLLSGYALAPDDDALWDGIAPWGEFEGQSARPLGALCGFVERLTRWREAMETPRPLADWAVLMRELLGVFDAQAPDEIAALGLLRQAVSDLAEQAERAEFSEPVPRTVARAALAARLAVPRHPRPFLSGRVTFCALAPMRSIPARVVWLLGMSEQDFPRRGRPPGFDLITAHPRRGDRARHTEDRALFLEALISARDSFQLSYVGRNQRDDSELPPSIVVSELLDVLTRMGVSGQDVVLAHPLQPFSSRYRPEPRRGASYAEEWLAGTDSTVAARAFAPAKPLEREIDRGVTLDELIRGLSNPARCFQRALGIAVPSEMRVLEDDEPFALDGLGRWKLRDALLARWLSVGAGFDPRPCRADFTARGWLPLGEAGEQAFQQAVEESGQLVEAVRKLVGDAEPQGRDIDLLLGDDWRLSGRVPNVYPDIGQVSARAGKTRAVDRLRTWINHLVLLSSQENAPLISYFIGLDTNKGRVMRSQWGEVEHPREQLLRLCELYARMQREVLPLLPDLSWTFVETLNKKGEHAARLKVDAQWNNDRVHTDGAEDFALVMRGREDVLFDEAFAALAEQVFKPILAAEERA